MATHKLLASGQLPNATPSTGGIYDPSGVTGMVKNIVLHNSNTSGTPETVEIYLNATGSAATDADKLLKVSIEAGETFEWSLGYMLIVVDANSIKGKSTTADKVNCFIFGADE